MKVSIEVGDIVSLKSGSHKMTVSKVHPEKDGEVLVKCFWCDQSGKIFGESFPKSVLDVKEDKR